MTCSGNCAKCFYGIALPIEIRCEERKIQLAIMIVFIVIICIKLNMNIGVLTQIINIQDMRGKKE